MLRQPDVGRHGESEGMMRRGRNSADRYLGTRTWCYKIPGEEGVGYIDLAVPEGNFARDKAQVALLIREKLRIGRLPNGTHVYPWRAPSR